MIVGTCKLHTTRSGVEQILSKFYHNKHLTRSYFVPVTPLWQFCPLALFYPSQCTNALLFNSATFMKKTGNYSQKNIINSKATSKTISRRFYHKILLTLWKRKIIGLCEYLRVSKMRNVTRAIMPNLGVAIWRTILNIKLLCFPRCVPELLL